MICSKCGAPIPAGMTRCPYCGAENTPMRRQRASDEETAFADVDEGEFPAEEDVKTEFAGGVWEEKSPADEEEKTEFAGERSVPPAASRNRIGRKPEQPARAAKAAKPPKAAKQKKNKPAKAGGSNNILRLVLVAILIVLIILLILR